MLIVMLTLSVQCLHLALRTVVPHPGAEQSYKGRKLAGCCQGVKNCGLDQLQMSAGEFDLRYLHRLPKHCNGLDGMVKSVVLASS